MSPLRPISFLLFILSLSLCPPAGQAQVYPGDVNADGRVDQYDLPYLGYAFGNFGPARIDDGSEFGPQNLFVEWTEAFPNGGPNFGHADCNGDGQIDLIDFLLINAYFGEQSSLSDSLVLPTGLPGMDPALDLDSPDTIYASPGQVLSIPLLLSHPTDTIAFNGMAFSMNYPADELEASVAFGNSWLKDSGTLSLVHSDEAGGELAVGLTRFGSDELLGNGPIAVVNFIVEGDLIELLEQPDDSLTLNIQFSDILLADGSFDFNGVVGGYTCIVVKHPDALVSTQETEEEVPVRIYPNPAREGIWLDSPVPIRRIDWISPDGRLLRTQLPEPLKGLYRLRRPGRGLFILRLITTDDQTRIHKIIFY